MSDWLDERLQERRTSARAADVRVEWTWCKPVVRCWVCQAYERAPSYPLPRGWLPEGWRLTRRGYAGPVAICGECTAAGRKYRSRRAGT